MRDRTMRAVTWTKVSFGDVVRQVKDRVDPEQSGLERYVAGEHMDTDDLRLRRWGEIGDGYLGPAFHMRFKPGHVLYGSRRTYLRKVAVADFEGITSNTTYVLEPKDPNVLLPELLPFIMQTEAFNQHSVRESKGSVNPYVNFSDLAWYEFALPPIEAQVQLAKVLKASSESVDGFRKTMVAMDTLVRAGLRAFVLGEKLTRRPLRPEDWAHGRPPGVVSLPRGWKVSRLVDVARLESGHTPSRRKPEYWSGSIPWISLHDTASLNRAEIQETEMHTTEAGIKNSSARMLPKGTVVVSRTASVGLVSVMGRPMATSQDFANFICDATCISAEYLYYYFRYLGPYLNAIAAGSTHKTVYMPFFEQMQVPLPPLEVQHSIAGQLRSLEDEGLRARQRHGAALDLHQRILGALIGQESA